MNLSQSAPKLDLRFRNYAIRLGLTAILVQRRGSLGSGIDDFELSAGLSHEGPQMVYLRPKIVDVFEYCKFNGIDRIIVCAFMSERTTIVIMLHNDMDLAEIYEYPLVDTYHAKLLGVSYAANKARPVTAIFTEIRSHIFIFEAQKFVQAIPGVLTEMAVSQNQIYALVYRQQGEWLVTIDLSNTQLVISHTKLDSVGARQLLLNYNGLCTAILYDSRLLSLVDGTSASVLDFGAFAAVFAFHNNTNFLISSTDHGVIVCLENLWIIAKLRLEYEGTVYCLEGYNQSETSIVARSMKIRKLCPPLLYSQSNGNCFALYCEDERVVLAFKLTQSFEAGNEPVVPEFCYALNLGRCSLKHLYWDCGDIVLVLQGLKQIETRLCYTDGVVTQKTQSWGLPLAQ